MAAMKTTHFSISERLKADQALLHRSWNTGRDLKAAAQSIKFL
jgi:hypothetical protein